MVYLKIALSAFVIFLLGLAIHILKAKSVQDEIKIYFPLTVLKPGPSLMDPSNTETVFEYYLLENLSCGLVRDATSSSTGYEGCLSDRFYQEDNKTWLFHLREIHWSDGQLVSPKEIEDWIHGLTTGQSRHVEFLKLVNEFRFDASTRMLSLHFEVPVDDGILHELSLADAALMPTNFSKNGWGRTVGPYRVDAWVDSTQPLKLVANRFSPLYSVEMPQIAQLFWLNNAQDRLGLFKETKVDIVPQTATANPIVLDKIKSNAAGEYVAHPTSILFFYFNAKNELGRNPDVRNEFANIISWIQSEYAQSLHEAYGWTAETQMVPEGFSGRTRERARRNPDTKHKSRLPKILKIGLFENFRMLPKFTNALLAGFARFGIKLEINFEDDPSKNPENLAGLYVFVGNQLDSSGSWSFLFSSHGVLHPWLGEVEKIYEAVFDISGISNREANLLRLHEAVLDKNLAVPVEVGSFRYLLSSRVDCSRWNKFDSRLRIYQLREKSTL